MYDFTTFLSRLSGRTKENYNYTLRLWAKWCDAHGIDVATATRQNIEEWIAERRAMVQPRTTKTDIGLLHGFYKWLAETGVRLDIPTMGIRRPRSGRSERPWLGRLDALRLLEAVPHWRGGELEPQVRLWLLSGLRPGEPRALQVGDLQEHDGMPALRVKATKTPGTEIIAIPESTADVLKRWASEKNERDFLLTNPATGAPWGKAAEGNSFRALVAHAGLPPVTPSSLRVSFVTLAIQAGLPEYEVSIAARHASSAQTAYYERLRDQADNPVGPILEDWLIQTPSPAPQSTPFRIDV
jgi:integrase/recombinase XerD